MKVYTNDLSKKQFNDNYCVVSDFDGTITSSSSASSIGIFRRIFDKSYSDILNAEMERLELDTNASPYEKTRNFAIFELKVLSEYLKNGIDINEFINKFEMRENIKYFFDFLNKEEKKIYINSSGVGNLIEQILKKFDMYSSNVEITSNYYDDNYQFDYSNIIFSKRKYNSLFLNKMDCYHSKILIGNSISDINMLPLSEKNNRNIYIGLFENYEKTMEYLKYFDIISLEKDICLPLKKVLSIK